MNAKTVVPWIIVVTLIAGAGVLYTSSRSMETELTRLRQENAELPELHAALEQVKKESQNQDADMSAKEREELIRLRNEVGILRRDKDQLSAQYQQAQKQQENQRAQQAQLLQQNQALTELTATQQTEQAKNVCINNLRQIDGAKQQWALENKQPPDAFVVAQQILPYLSNRKMPACPSGGVYAMGNVSTPPTCTVPGHVVAR